MNMALVSCENVSVVFRQRRERMLLRDHLREIVTKTVPGGFYALHDVSFNLDPGESIGIVGANGAGKSTLLSLLAGLTMPDQGSVAVRGRVGALLELGSGFHPDLTGRENILMNAALMGLSEREARKASEAIIGFSELAEFIDEPLRTYSSGMVLRLGFSVAIHADVEILLIDEILAVGDMAFQKKCFASILNLRSKGKTLVCVSHAPAILAQLCDRLLWLHHGQVVADGTFDEVSRRYSTYMSNPERRLDDQVGDVVLPSPREVKPPERRNSKLKSENPARR